MVVFDTSFLAIAFDAKTPVPNDPTTGKPVSDCAARINALIEALSIARKPIIIPTPVLAEYLVQGGAQKSQRLQVFQSSTAFSIKSFDQLAAVECAMLEDADLKSGKPLDPVVTKAKVKFDRQIIAIAKVHKATAIYTGDRPLASRAKENGLNAIMTWEIPLPPISEQMTIEEVKEDEAKPPVTAIEPPKEPTATEPVKAEPQPAAGATGAAPPVNGSSAKAHVVDAPSAPAQ